MNCRVKTPNFKGKGLLVYSDPGGAKNIISLARKLKEKNKLICMITDREYNIFDEFNYEIIKFNGCPKYYFQKYKPNFLLTGTSYTSNIEIEFIKESFNQGIPSYAYIDHWTNIRGRFSYNNGREVLPNYVLVIDKIAKQKAISEGLNAKSIQIVGQPYLEYLSKWKPKLSRKDFLLSLGLSSLSSKVVVYAPDPLSNINGKNVYGFDEYQATNQLIELFKNFPEVILLIKPHPNQSVDLFNAFDRLKKNVLLLTEIDNKHLIYYSDLVIGFFSNFLLEAGAMKKKILRFHPVPIIDDPLKHIKLGIIVNSDNFSMVIKDFL